MLTTKLLKKDNSNNEKLFFFYFKLNNSLRKNMRDTIWLFFASAKVNGIAITTSAPLYLYQQAADVRKAPLMAMSLAKRETQDHFSEIYTEGKCFGHSSLDADRN